MWLYGDSFLLSESESVVTIIANKNVFFLDIEPLIFLEYYTKNKENLLSKSERISIYKTVYAVLIHSCETIVSGLIATHQVRSRSFWHDT